MFTFQLINKSHTLIRLLFYMLDVKFVSNKFYTSLLFVTDGPEKYCRLPVPAKI